MEDLDKNKEVQTIGEMLKNARMEQNITLEEAAEELCIRKFYLNAIENMDFENIPSMPYGLGFIRSYAKLLGLNSDRIVFSYKQIMSGEQEIRPQQEKHHSESSTPRLKHFILGALGLVLLVIAWSVLPTTSKFEDAPEQNSSVLPEPLIVNEEEEKVSVVEVEEKAEPAAKNEKTAESEISKEAEDTKEKVEEKKSEVKEENKQVQKATLPKMRIVLSGPSWLELRQGQKVLLNGVYNKSYKYDLPSEKGLIISVGRPRNVHFFLDDKEIQVASNLKRKNISLDAYFKTDN